jgi:hypothetical protein
MSDSNVIAKQMKIDNKLEDSQLLQVESTVKSRLNLQMNARNLASNSRSYQDAEAYINGLSQEQLVQL